MATTSPDNISYPTNASAKKTIEGHIQDTATSVQTAITDVRGDVDTLLSAKANLSGASFTGNVTASYGGTSTRLSLGNTTAGSDQYLSGITFSNDTGYKVSHFLNSSTRTADGGVNGYTIRNDGGPLTLGNPSTTTTVSGNYVLMPSQPYFLAYSYTYGGTNYNAGDVVSITQIRRQVGSSYNTSNSRFTAPVSGNYFLWFVAYNTGNAMRVNIRLNGAISIFGQGGGYPGVDYHQSGVTYLAAGDYADVRVTYNTTNLYLADNHTEFGGLLLG